MTRFFRWAAAVVAAVGLGMTAVSGCAVEVEPTEPADDSVTIAESAEELSRSPMTRDQILDLAQSGVGYSYYWGGDRWDPTSKKNPGSCSGSCPSCTHYGQWGADCSGYVGQIWQVPHDRALTKQWHPYSTYNFKYEKSHWYPIKKSQLKAGDALVYHTSGAGHIALFHKWSGGGKALAYECAGCKIGCIHKPRYFASYYTAIRRRDVENEPVNHPPKGRLNKSSCDNIHGWAQDPDDKKQPIDVVLTFGGPITNKNAKRITVRADEHRKDLCKKLGTCNHAFTAKMPKSLRDGKKHSVYAYAEGSNGKGRKLLAGSPRAVKCENEGRQMAIAAPGGTCEHSACSTGAALDKNCSPCASYVCILKPECCTGSWDQSCVDLAGDSVGWCAGECGGGASSCGHSECQEGSALPPTCSKCAEHVCERDAFCCSNQWDWICATEASNDAFCSCPNGGFQQ